jgi:hypothetical protein
MQAVRIIKFQSLAVLPVHFVISKGALQGYACNLPAGHALTSDSATAGCCYIVISRCLVCCAGAASDSSSDSESDADLVASDEDDFVDSAKQQQQQRKPLPGSAAAAASTSAAAATSSAGTALGHGPPTEAEQQAVLEWLRKEIRRSGGSLGDSWKVQLSGRRPTGGFKSRKFVAPDGTVCYTAPQVRRHLGLEQPGEHLQIVYLLWMHCLAHWCVSRAFVDLIVRRQLSEWCPTGGFNSQHMSCA